MRKRKSSRTSVIPLSADQLLQLAQEALVHNDRAEFVRLVGQLYALLDVQEDVFGEDADLNM